MSAAIWAAPATTRYEEPGVRFDIELDSLFMAGVPVGSAIISILEVQLDAATDAYQASVIDVEWAEVCGSASDCTNAVIRRDTLDRVMLDVSKRLYVLEHAELAFEPLTTPPTTH